MSTATDNRSVSPLVVPSHRRVSSIPTAEALEQSRVQLKREAVTTPLWEVLNEAGNRWILQLMDQPVNPGVSEKHRERVNSAQRRYRKLLGLDRNRTLREERDALLEEAGSVLEYLDLGRLRKVLMAEISVVDPLKPHEVRDLKAAVSLVRSKLGRLDHQAAVPAPLARKGGGKKHGRFNSAAAAARAAADTAGKAGSAKSKDKAKA